MVAVKVQGTEIRTRKEIRDRVVSGEAADGVQAVEVAVMRAEEAELVVG